MERIIDSHNGSPKINVKIRCLDVLKKYGIRPSRLIVIILKNSVVTDWLNPFRLNINVRESCAMIIIKNGVIIDEFRVDETQNVS